MRAHTVKLIGVVLAASLIFAACGSEDDSDADTGIEQDADGTDDAGDDKVGSPEGTLVWGLASNGANFYDPHVATNPFGRSWMYPFYDRLTQAGEDGAVEPMLATGWEFSEDGSTLTFTLRDDVVFHDGARFNAKAAKANIDRARDPEFATGTYVDLLAVDSVEVVDEYIVQLSLSRPGGALPALLSDQAGMMISPDAFDNEDLGTMPVGAGPFVAREFRVDEAMLAVAFDQYWNPELPKVAELELRYILDPSTRINAIASGEIHGAAVDIGTHSRDDLAELGLEVTEGFSTALYQLFINTALVPELASTEVRAALAMAIDQQTFSDVLLNGECGPTDQPFGASWYPANPDVTADFLPYDPDAARAKLEAEGAAGLEFTAITPNIPSYVGMSEAVSGFLSKIGVTMTVAPTPLAELIAGFVVNKTADAYFSLNPGAADPAKFVGSLFLPVSPFNPGGYEAPGLMDLHNQAQQSYTEAERAPIYHEMGELLAREQVGIHVCTPANLMAHSPDVSGVELLLTSSDVDVAGISVNG